MSEKRDGKIEKLKKIKKEETKDIAKEQLKQTRKMEESK
jgi:hypothetical protein